MPIASSAPWSRRPTRADAAAVHALVEHCPPLDTNSLYAYLLICTHFSETSAVAGYGDRLAGFLSAYIKPDAPADLFVWQIAVDPRERGRALAGKMLDDVLARSACRNLRFVEATIATDNHASHRVFQRMAAARRAPFSTAEGFVAEDFGSTGHAPEPLIRVGPLGSPLSTK